MNNWRSDIPLGEVADIVGGGTPSRDKKEYWGRGLPWVTPSDITSAKIKNIVKTKEQISEEGLKKSSAKLLPKGTVMMSSRATIGECAINRVPMATNQGFANFICKDLTYNEFLYYLLKFNKPQLEQLSSGSTFKEISKKSLKTFRINLPPYIEQTKIATILTSVDDAIEKTEAIIKQTEKVKIGLMQHVFTNGFKKYKFNNLDMGEFQEDWYITTIGEIAKVGTGGTPKRSIPEYYEGEIPWIKTTEINYKVINEAEEYITENGLNSSAAKLYPRGTILLAMYGQGVTRGRVGVLGIEAAINQACAAIQVSEKVINMYLYYFLAFNYENIRMLGHGSNQSNLNLNLIKSFKVSLPPLREQIKIVEILDSIFGKISMEKQKKSKLNEIKTGLMQDLLTGKVRVNVDEEKVVSS